MKNPVERILVPLDGSVASDAALYAIAPLHQMRHPEVILLGVMDAKEEDPKLKSHVEFTAHSLRSKGVNATTLIRTGKPAAEIVAVAREKAVDLIAMSTHGRGGLARVFLGSVTEEVLRHANVPLLVCRPGATAGEWNRIVVALDGSEIAEQILPQAVRIAKAAKGSIDLVRVAIPIVAASGVGEFPLVIPGEDPAPYLKGVSGRLMAEGVEARAVPLEGRAAATILEHATQAKAGLICMTTHGRSGVPRVFLGSIAEEILRHAPCPVLLRRLAGHPSPVEVR